MNAHHLLLVYNLLGCSILLVFPIWAVLRLRRTGVFIAIIFVWLFSILSDFATTHGSISGLLLLFGGWIIALIYVAILTGLITLVMKIGHRMLRKPPVAPPPSPASFRQWQASLHPLERLGLALICAYLCTLLVMALNLPPFTS